MHITFKSVALSYKNTPLEIREKIAYDEKSSKRLMRDLRDILGLQETMILSTCNRTEIYYSSNESRFEDIVKVIRSERGLEGDVTKYFEAIDNHNDAVQHLFYVAMGLEAQVVGDMQISNQVKNAYQWSADENMAGPFLHRLMHTIFFSNKRVVQETPFRDGAASVSYAATDLVKDLTREFQEPKVLVIGLGEIGLDVVKNLYEHTKCDVTISNRTFAKAEEIAAEHGYKTLPYENFEMELKNYDVIISSVRKNEPIISSKSIETIEILSHKFFIDLSVPRSIAANVEDVHGALLYNIDDIHDKANAALEIRKKSIPAVEKIIEESIAEFNNWARETEVSPTIQKLKGALEDIRKAELAKHMKNISPDQEEILEVVTKGMLQKIIKLPVLQLKAACKRGEAETLIDVLNNLFDLESQPLKK
ncbi:MAG: glutamyl-tRNA reductase [bacterium]|nr:glutamyl-tRNA reductase [bacterium]